MTDGELIAMMREMAEPFEAGNMSKAEALFSAAADRLEAAGRLPEKWRSKPALTGGQAERLQCAAELEQALATGAKDE